MAWRQDQAEALVQLWKAGVSSGEIAVKLGVTRNAVIGKAGRLGLLGSRAEPRPRPSNGRSNGNGRVATVVAVKLGEQDRPSAGAGIPLTQLRRGVCHWPIPQRDQQGLRMYCGAQTINGPWCEPHKALSVRKTNA